MKVEGGQSFEQDFLRLKDEQDDDLACLFYPVYPKIL
jgi:hypothetical protein